MWLHNSSMMPANTHALYPSLTKDFKILRTNSRRVWRWPASTCYLVILNTALILPHTLPLAYPLQHSNTLGDTWHSAELLSSSLFPVQNICETAMITSPLKMAGLFFFFLQWHILEKSEDFMSSFICTLTQATRNNVRMDEAMGWGLPCSWIKIVFKLHMRPHIVNTKQEGYTNICRATRSIKVL